jgi:hypothetical protein
MIRERTQQLAYHPIRFKLRQKYRIASRENRKLMNRAIAVNNFPARGAYEIADLWNPLAPVKRLIIAAIGMSHT